MPVLDKPLSELQSYTGISPKPEDFDAYWQTAITELDAIAPNANLNPAAVQFPNGKCFDLTFTSANNATIYAKYLTPSNTTDKPRPTVLYFHGYTGCSPDWNELIKYTAVGFNVAALDVRGQAGKSQDNTDTLGTTLRGHIIRGLADSAENLLFKNIFLDTLQLTRTVSTFPEVDADHLMTYGGSQGGALSLVCAALTPSIKKCVALFPFLSDYKRVWEMDLSNKHAYFELSDFLRKHDPTHQHIDTWFNRLGYIDIKNLVPRIKASVLFAATLMDEVCPPSTQFAAYNNIQSQKDIIVYPDFGHEHLPGFPDTALTFLLQSLS
ncbi:alpha/beta fold hydrolase [Poriferisphaera sp. WC338]|uniref:alpha/beta fold hydrolase n=1 Tax=Poriferisphaera sp. WC338 TaxID=3425129 RepID=UPI003D8158A5